MKFRREVARGPWSIRAPKARVVPWELLQQVWDQLPDGSKFIARDFDDAEDFIRKSGLYMRPASVPSQFGIAIQCLTDQRCLPGEVFIVDPAIINRWTDSGRGEWPPPIGVVGVVMMTETEAPTSPRRSLTQILFGWMKP